MALSKSSATVHDWTVINHVDASDAAGRPIIVADGFEVIPSPKHPITLSMRSKGDYVCIESESW